MKLKKSYRFDNNRQIWRIIPFDKDKLIIEEREPENKQTYFHCLSIDSGKKIFSNFQLEDKFWVGIETVKDDIIYFHKFAKPDMPKHRGIFAFNVYKKEFIWQNADLIFLFLFNGKLYAYKDKFEGRNYYSINPANGEIIEELGENYGLINNLRNLSSQSVGDDGLLFSETFDSSSNVSIKAEGFIKSFKEKFVVSGKIEYILKNQLLLISFHEANSKGSLNNLFKAVDLSKGKYILEEVINKEIKLFMTDSFFVRNNLLFLLFGKTRLEVFKITD